MKYFLHDTSAFDDEKVSELFINFGYEGLGLFYTALEKIGKQEKPIKTDVLLSQLRVGKRLLKCWNFIEQIGLISSSNGESFNEQLLNFSEKYQIKKEKTREKVLQWRKKQDDTKNVTGYVHICNHPKVKESKVNISKVKEYKEKECEIISILTFEEFWNLYDKKVGDKEKLCKKWDSIKESEREKIRDHILQYKISQPDKKYRKDPQTYLNNHSWNDEIIQTNGTNQKHSPKATNISGIVDAVFANR